LKSYKNGWVRPAINYLLRDFRKYLIQKKIDQDFSFAAHRKQKQNQKQKNSLAITTTLPALP
jgi:hypothetical protein